MEFIIPNVTEEESDILENNDIEWYPDDLCTRDVVICGSKRYFEEVLKLIGRK